LPDYPPPSAIQDSARRLFDSPVEPGLDAPQSRAISSSAERALCGVHRLAAEVVALIYIAVVAEIAYATGAFYILFPELAALAHDVFTRPRGTWASAPLLLAITPVLTGAIGIFFTRELPYGYLSVLLTVAGAVAVILVLDSPIAPAISAGLLPLTLSLRSWWYPPGVLLGTILLAGLSILWAKLGVARNWLRPLGPQELVEEAIEGSSRSYFWLLALMIFVAAAISCVELSGHLVVRRLLGNSTELRFILFPPLVVIGFEMFGHSDVCPWARKPLLLPVTCFASAAGGLLCWTLFGNGAFAATLSMIWGIGVLRLFDLHVPPALAVALLPQVMTAPTIAYPLSVGTGTLFMTLWFLLCKSMTRRANRATTHR
jgi:hypothetical protein